MQKLTVKSESRIFSERLSGRKSLKVASYERISKRGNSQSMSCALHWCFKNKNSDVFWTSTRFY